MFVYFFDPSYTSAEMLRHIASALKVRKVFSMMRAEDLTEDLLNLHNSSFVNFWSPSTEDKYEVAFKEVARKIFPIISYPWFMDGKLMGYMSKGGASIKKQAHLFIGHVRRTVLRVLGNSKHYGTSTSFIQHQLFETYNTRTKSTRSYFQICNYLLEKSRFIQD